MLVSSRRQALALQPVHGALDPGDEVLIPAPYWVSYPDMVMLAGGKPVIVETKRRGRLRGHRRAGRAPRAPPRTRAIVLNKPSNPTGAVYTRAQIEAIAKVVVEKDILVVSDDIYRQLVYGDAEYVSIAAVWPRGREAHDPRRRRVEDVRDDRLAHRLHRRAASPLVKAMSQDPGPVDVEPDAHRAGRDARRADRPAGVRRDDAQGVRQAPRSRW